MDKSVDTLQNKSLIAFVWRGRKRSVDSAPPRDPLCLLLLKSSGTRQLNSVRWNLLQRSAAGPHLLHAPRSYHPVLRSLFDGLRTSCAGSSEGGTGDEALWRAGSLRRGCPAVGTIHRATAARRPSIIAIVAARQKGEKLERQEVSCIANGCSNITPAHAAATAVAEQMRQKPTPSAPPARSHISSSLTPQRHMSLTDRPSVCFPLRDEVHFLCSLCFRPQIKKRDLPFKKRRVYIVWVLWGKAQSRHTVGGL